MFKFNCYFLDQDLDNAPSPEKYRDFFLKYDPDSWSSGAGDGVFDARFENGDVATLSVLEEHSLGISVRFNFRRSGERSSQEYYSVGNHKEINNVDNVGDDQFLPIGSFLKPEQAWLAVEDFFENPCEKSNRIEWMSSDEIEWE